MDSGIFSTIGCTPLILLENVYPEMPINIYAKLEMFNPGGSIKDRPAWLMLSKAMEQGKIDHRSTIIESSSGNMAIGLAQVCRYLDLDLIVVADPKINNHTLKILRAYGTKIDTISKADDNGNYLNARLTRVQQLLDHLPNGYWPNQYANKNNIAAQFHTMDEIVTDAPNPPDYMFAATSTCGTIMGCANYVKQNNLHTKIVAVDAVGSVIFGNPSTDRQVPGHGAGRPSDLLDEKAIDHVLHITDEECIIGCRRLLHREAILAGGSSGAVVMALEKLQPSIPDGSTCAIILADSGERYLDTVFNNEWLAKHFEHLNLPSNNYLDEDINQTVTPITFNGTKTQNETTKIAIIGGGPKGTFGFERLAAQLSTYPSSHPVEIHVYNKSSNFGAGDIYRPRQPSYLLINNPVGDINMWIDENPPAVVDEPLSLTDWLCQKEVRNVTESDYTGRDTVGRYLIDGFQKIASNLPDNVRGKYMVGKISDISKNGDQYALTLKDTAGNTTDICHRYNHILLATGHPTNRLTEQDEMYKEFVSCNKDVGFVPFIYPVEENLQDISPHSRVAVKGIGLTFVDAVLALTEGRGGTFKREPEGKKLTYLASGNEPEAIYPFSRSGLPMLPREPALPDETPLKFFTKSALKKLKENNLNGKLDFKNQIWPLLKQEYIFTFYEIKLRATEFKDDLSSCATFAEVKHHITAFHEQYPDAKRFDPDRFLNPLSNRTFDDAGAYNRYIQSYLEFYLKEAMVGEQNNPWAAVISVWRKATPLFGKYYAFGGLTPASQQYFDGKFRRLLNRVTFGPPVESVEKLIALIDSGILNFKMARNPTVYIHNDKGTFTLESHDRKIQNPINYLVDARISKVSLTQDRSPLYRNMLRRGLITLYQNKSQQNSYQPGCIAVSQDGFAIGKDGVPNPDITVTGTPTEGVTFDNDALSRTRNNFVSSWAASIRKKYAKSTINNHAT